MHATEGARHSPGWRIGASLRICGLVILLAQVASAEVVRIDVRRRDDFGTHERVIGRVHFAIDPKLPANRAIADIDLAPKNADGKVEFSSDLLFFRPKRADRARGSVFLEVVNRGRDQSLAIMSGAQQRDLSPESWDLGDRFLLEQGFAVAFLGWQFDVRPSEGLTFQAPIAPVDGLVRETHIEVNGGRTVELGFAYCALGPAPSRRDAHVSRTDGCRSAADATRDMAIRRRRVLGPLEHDCRRRHLRSGVPGEGIAGGRSWPGRDSRLRVVSAATARPAPRCAKHRPRSSGSSATATRRADDSCASSFATASTPTSAAGRRSMR